MTNQTGAEPHQIIAAKGIQGFGDTYTHFSGEEKRVVYLFSGNEEDEISLGNVPEKEITPQVLSSPRDYSLITIKKGGKKITKLASRAAGFMAQCLL